MKTIDDAKQWNGWLSPNGNMFDGSHHEVALRFYSHTHNPHAGMERAGWWRVTESCGRLPYWVGWKPATHTQRGYIVDWTRNWNTQNAWSKWSSLFMVQKLELPDFEGTELGGFDDLRDKARLAAKAAGGET